MKFTRTLETYLTLPLILIIFTLSCTRLIGPYSPTAYQLATSMKVETLALMDKAVEPYDNHKGTAGELMVELQKAHEYSKGAAGHIISASQWHILIRSDGDLIGKFFKRWKERGTLSQIYIRELKGIVSNAFDEIICLETNLKKPNKCKQP